MFKKIFCGLSLIYILYLLTVQVGSFKYLTTWTIIVQGLYLASEFHWNPKIPRIFQNLAWTPNIFLASYWPIRIHWKWAAVDADLLPDLMEHCFNIILVLIVALWHPRLKKEYWPDIDGRDEIEDISIRLTDHKKKKNYYMGNWCSSCFKNCLHINSFVPFAD